MGRRLKILTLEPYYGGSHRAFLDVLIRHSRHDFRLMSLPARKWKWRMRGAAVWFAERIRRDPVGDVDLIFTSDMLSVAELRSLLPRTLRNVPVLCYFHENQLTYPLSEHDRRDYQFGFTNITSCLASDEVWFNSAAHRDAFLAAVDELLRQMPDHVPQDARSAIESRSTVAWPLVEFPDPTTVRRSNSSAAETPVILWCHRWEYDKNPEAFFRTLFRLDDRGFDFNLVLLGESFRRAPEAFGEAWAKLERRIVHSGYLENRDDYWRRLASCDIVVSTAIQENFGLAVAEAIAAGCHPLLPDRLSYPELIPETERSACLYKSEDDLEQRLGTILEAGASRGCSGRVATHLRDRCDAKTCISLYDKALDALATPP